MATVLKIPVVVSGGHVSLKYPENHHESAQEARNKAENLRKHLNDLKRKLKKHPSKALLDKINKLKKNAKHANKAFKNLLRTSLNGEILVVKGHISHFSASLKKAHDPKLKQHINKKLIGARIKLAGLMIKKWTPIVNSDRVGVRKIEGKLKKAEMQIKATMYKIKIQTIADPALKLMLKMKKANHKRMKNAFGRATKTLKKHILILNKWKARKNTLLARMRLGSATSDAVSGIVATLNRHTKMLKEIMSKLGISHRAHRGRRKCPPIKPLRSRLEKAKRQGRSLMKKIKEAPAVTKPKFRAMFKKNHEQVKKLRAMYRKALKCRGKSGCGSSKSVKAKIRRIQAVYKKHLRDFKKNPSDKMTERRLKRSRKHLKKARHHLQKIMKCHCAFAAKMIKKYKAMKKTPRVASELKKHMEALKKCRCQQLKMKYHKVSQLMNKNMKAYKVNKKNTEAFKKMEFYKKELKMIRVRMNKYKCKVPAAPLERAAPAKRLMSSFRRNTQKRR